MAKRLVVLGLAVLFCVFLWNAPRVSGQAVFGNIIGTVTDPQGNAVAGAKVTVTSTTKSFAYDTTTNESGNYAVTHLIPDTYKVHIEATGFKAYDVPNVSVSADTSASINAPLQVGAVTQTVEVTGEIPQLQTDRADVDIQFSQQYIEDLPVLNRNFTNFELLSPGTQKLVGWSHAATENPQGGGQIFVNGQHFSGTNFELDGTDNQDAILGIIVVNPNLDAVAEAKIALQDYDAESGKAVAGTVGVQIKSGSNDFHGSGFFYYRNSDQQARDPFTNAPGVPLAAATWKQYGGSVGGPIIKDKLFFFADYQGTKQIQGITNQYTIPTAEVISTCNPATNTTGSCDLSQYLDAYGPVVNGVHSGQIYQPGTYVAAGCAVTQAVALATGACRMPFANNMIPITMISAGMGKLIAEFPTPTVPVSGTGTSITGINNNFVSTGNGPYNQYSVDTRVDYAAPHNYQVFGRFSLDYFNLSGLGGLGALGGAGFGPGGLNGSSVNHDYSVAGGFNKAIGTRWLTDFRIGWFQYNPVTHYSDASASPMDALGFPGLNSGPGIQGPPTTGGLSGFSFSGNGSPSTFGDGLNIGRCNCPLTERERQIQFVNNWTRTQGNHTIKFGVDIRYATNLRIPSDSSRTGILNFDAGDTSLAGSNGLALATMLLGDVTSFQRFVSPPNVQAIGHQWRQFLYGQDTWRVSPKFTMTYGLRWEIYNPEAVTAKGNAGFGDLNNGELLVAGYGGVSNNGGVANSYKAFAPRVSFAYQFDPKTVLRLGYGRGFDIGVFGSSFGHAVTQNLPVLASQNLSDSNFLGSGFQDNRSAVFNLVNGPPAYPFANLINDLNTNGYLPLLGPDGTASTYIRPRVQRLPTIDQWNATVQRQVTSTLNITVSYVGNKGTHMFNGDGPSYGLNDPAIGTGTAPVTCNPNCSVSFKPSIPANERRALFLNGVYAFPYTGIAGYAPCCSGGVGNYFGNDANNNYNALQIKAEKRTSYGLQFLAHYTFSKAYAYNSGYYDVNPVYAYGPNDQNRNHEFVANTIYQLPFGKGKQFLSNAGRAMDLAIGGWQVSNTLTWGGGLPWTPSIGECGVISDAGPCRPNVMNGEKLKTGTQRVNGALYWFVPVAPLSYGNQVSAANVGVDSCTFARPTSGPFSLPACGQIGNLGSFSYRGPHVFYDDMSLSKSFTITERVKAQFRFDAYNVFNHPVLGFNGNQGNTCIDCGGTAGQITDIQGDNSPGSPTGMRQLQFGVRVIF